MISVLTIASLWWLSSQWFGGESHQERETGTAMCSNTGETYFLWFQQGSVALTWTWREVTKAALTLPLIYHHQPCSLRESISICQTSLSLYLFFFTSRVTKRIHFCIHFAFISEKKSKSSGWEKGRLESKWDFRTGPFSDNLSKESGPELLLGRHEKLSVCEKILHSYFLFKTFTLKKVAVENCANVFILVESKNTKSLQLWH